MINQKNLKNKLDELEQLRQSEALEEAEVAIDAIEKGLFSSAVAVRDFLVNKFDEVIKDKEE